ncbi:AzlC family ABC transporter permease [Helicobacter mehlei]|uniref:AzlC family ABC transporter permease n=1 Tax=Helicobacter mehlei TaxID=2316080 RepID=UPI000EACBFAE|nr:AzlC family ABC transporter permease [Helicobacter mehlei]
MFKTPLILAFKEAFPHTIPICLGYLLMGVALGIFLQQNGYGVFATLCMSLFVYAGAVQFMVVALVSVHASLLNIFLLVAVVNARQICYAIAMIEPFSGMKKRLYYIAHALSDETFMLLNVAQPKQSVREDFMLAIALLNQSYWVLGTLLGSLLGDSFKLDVRGMSFVMVSIFVVIFMEQWKSTSRHAPALIGLMSALVCFIIFGKSHFLLPTLAIMVAIFLLFKRRLD